MASRSVHNQISTNKESGKGITGVLFALFVIALIGGVLYYTIGQVVPPGYMGVRQTTVGPTQGYSTHGLSPGLRIAVPFVSKIFLVPRTVQLVSFNRKAAGESEESQANESLEIRTSDGVAVNVDISVLTRFYDQPGEGHGGPEDLFTKVGSTLQDWDNQIRRVAADELRQSLGAMLARQFYEEPKTRLTALETARTDMQKRLAPFGIEVKSILLRRYTFSDDRIDQAIFNKNLQEQEQRLKDASSKLAEVKAHLEQVSAEWDAKVETLRIKGENQAQVLKSEAALFENEKKAEGDLLVAKASAEVDRLRATALAQSTGADIYVARELAPLLASLKGGVVNNLDPYDLDSWVKRLGVDVKASPRLKLLIPQDQPAAHTNVDTDEVTRKTRAKAMLENSEKLQESKARVMYTTPSDVISDSKKNDTAANGWKSATQEATSSSSSESSIRGAN